MECFEPVREQPCLRELVRGDWDRIQDVIEPAVCEEFGLKKHTPDPSIAVSRHRQITPHNKS